MNKKRIGVWIVMVILLVILSIYNAGDKVWTHMLTLTLIVLSSPFYIKKVDNEYFD
jgi:hypothetical protein